MHLDVDYALQMSPLFPKEAPRRPERTRGDEPVTLTSRQRQQDFSIAAAITAPQLQTYDPEAQIRQWTSYQVIDWMVDCDMDASTIDCFEANDINGDVLLDLQFEHLRDQLGIQSFGKRHQLWSAICSLRGAEPDFGTHGTPFQDTSRPSTRNETRSPKSACHTPIDGDMTPIETSHLKKRRGRKHHRLNEDVAPAESVSIVAIEQLIPKPHKCHKGERCAKWRKQQRELKQLQDEGVLHLPVSPTKGGRIYIATDSSRSPTVVSLAPSARKQSDNAARLTTDTMPSLIASSDLLGPGQLPDFALHANVLDRLGNRDPQEHVRQYLSLQHVGPATRSPAELAQPGSIPRSTSAPFAHPRNEHQGYATSIPPRNFKTPGPRESLRSLPKLEILRSQTATPAFNTSFSATTPCRSAGVSPTLPYRLGTPESEMDVPVTAIPTGPVSRDMTQSVPANMQFRQSNRSSPVRSATADPRRPSMPLPALKENEVLLSTSTLSGSSSASSVKSLASNSSSTGGGSAASSNTSIGSTSGASQPSLRRTKSTHDPFRSEPAVKHFGYGEECTHAGYMKKRKTKLLRHEWQEGHFRLVGFNLSMHENARLQSAALEKINVENYGIACSSAAASSKLSAAMKAFYIKSSNIADAAKADQTAFNFQLVPNKEGVDGERRLDAKGKTHHFAVKTKDERIDWMRELMLAKALQQKGKGYEVQVNGKKF